MVRPTCRQARALAALVSHIATINTWNRLNVTTGQVSGEWTA
jgi:hypothetical protein